MKFITLVALFATVSAINKNKRFPADVQDANPDFPTETHEMTPLTAHDNHQWSPVEKTGKIV